MQKKFNKAIEMLEAKKAEQLEREAKAERDIKEAKKRIDILQASLDNSESVEEYTSILSEIRNNESALKFFEKKAEDAKAPVLTIEEYNEIASALRGACVEIKTEQGAEIAKEIKKLIKMFLNYDEEINDINNLLNKARRMNKSVPISVIDPSGLFEMGTDERVFSDCFYSLKQRKGLLNKGFDL